MNKQRKNMPRQAVALALCALAAAGANAQDSGRLVVFSHLSEPLSAAAPLALPSGAQATDVTARVASEQLYAAAGAKRPAWADQARISARPVGANRVELRVSTAAPVEDPASTLILEIEVKGSGSSTKQYAVILDPVEMGRPVAKADASDGSKGLEAKAALQAPAKAQEPAKASEARVVVKSGQILYAIAQAKRPSDVSVERMMVGMLRVNPRAFAQGNVNRLKAGAVLRMPGAGELASISQAEAAALINRQATDFAKWRSIASKPAEAAGSGEGKVDKAVSAPESGPDVLRLGKAQAGKRDATDEIAQKNRQAEAKARVDELERMRDDAKKAMTLATGGELAALEARKAAEAAKEAPAKAESKEAKPEAKPEESKGQEAKPEASEAKAATPKPTPKPAPKAPEPEPSFVDSAISALSENGLYVAGGLAALLAAVAGLARRRKNKHGFSGPTTIVPDAGAAHAPAASPSQEPEISEFQTHLNSADTYLAFNKLDRAADEVRQALEIEPKNLDALILGARVAAKSQEREALGRFGAQIGDLTFKNGPYWDEVDALLAQASRGEEPAEPAVAPAPAHVDFSADLERSLMDLAGPAPTPAPTPAPEPARAEFEAPPLPSFELPDPAPTSSDPFAGLDFTSSAPVEDPRSESLSFDLSLPDDAPVSPEPLSFEPIGAPQPEPELESAQSEVENELRTMLDLAKAYVEMGDKDGARELLTEIEQKGSPTLSAKARELLSSI